MMNGSPSSHRLSKRRWSTKLLVGCTKKGHRPLAQPSTLASCPPHLCSAASSSKRRARARTTARDGSDLFLFIFPLFLPLLLSISSPSNLQRRYGPPLCFFISLSPFQVTLRPITLISSISRLRISAYHLRGSLRLVLLSILNTSDPRIHIATT